MNLSVLLVAAVALGAGGLLWYLFGRWPAAGLVFWLSAVCFMPVWWSVRVGVDWRPATVAGLLLLASYVGRFPKYFSAADLGIALLFLAGVFPLFFGGASASSVFGLATQWILGFLLGRVVLMRLGEERVYRIIVVMFAIVAVLALLEFAFDWHPWSGLGPQNELYAIWGHIQGRAGLFRAEGAFGHSIALGCSLALALPFIFATEMRTWVRFALASLALGATLVTLSRAALLSASLSCLMIAVLGGRRYDPESRRTAILLLLVGVLVSLPVVSSVLATAGEEAGRSAEYRGRLLDLVSAMQPLGLSGAGRTAVNGERYIGKFQSIDSQFILTGLTYGWIVLVLGLILLVLAGVLVTLGKASPGILAAVAQVPALATVALITQYGTFFWFVVGVGVAAQAQYNQADKAALSEVSYQWRPTAPTAIAARFRPD